MLTFIACSVAIFSCPKPVIISTTSSIGKDFTSLSGDVIEIILKISFTEARIRLEAAGVRPCVCYDVKRQE